MWYSGCTVGRHPTDAGSNPVARSNKMRRAVKPGRNGPRERGARNVSVADGSGRRRTFVLALPHGHLRTENEALHARLLRERLSTSGRAARRSTANAVQRGSTPRGCSNMFRRVAAARIGRASRSHREGCGFESRPIHQIVGRKLNWISVGLRNRRLRVRLPRGRPQAGRGATCHVSRG